MSLSEALDRLVSRGVLTKEQADAVRAEVAAPRGGERGGGRRGVSPAAEVAAYLGGVVTAVALGFLVAEPYQDAPRGVKALMLGLLAAVLVGAGFALRDPEGDDPVRGRLSGTLWATAVGAAGWAAGALLADEASGETTVLGVGLTALALAVPLYALQRSIGQLLALVVAALVAVTGAIVALDLGAAGGGAVVAALGAAVLGLGLAGRLEPAGASVPGGAALGLVGLQVVAFDDGWRGVAILAAVAACVGLFAVATRRGALVAAVGTVGMTAALPQAIVHVGGDGVSTPLVLLVTGLALLGGAALTNRLRR